jgi:D-psicose/D-tagatose/L-ribulose 3-epimerase
MKVGFNVLFWTPFFSEDHFHRIEALKAIGYDGLELPLFEGDPSYYQVVGKVLRDAGLRSTAVTVIPDESRSLVSPDAANRQRGVDYLKWAVDCCHAAGSEVLCGPMHQPLGIFTGLPPTDQERERAADAHREVATYAQSAGVALAVEALNRFECYFLNTHDQAAAHVRQVAHPNFHMMFDTFHANMEEKDTVQALARNIGLVRHVHISENDRGAPGTGQVPWEGVFQTLAAHGYDGWLTVEAFSRALPELAAVTKVWRQFDPMEAVYEGGHRFIRDSWAKSFHGNPPR